MSWYPVPIDHEFPVQNLPKGRVRYQGRQIEGVRLGDSFLAFEGLQTHALPITRQGIQGLFADDAACSTREKVANCLIPLDKVQPQLPMEVRAFVDFYSGIHHASNVGRMFRPDQPPLLPNYRHLPIGYNGRASSVFVSGSPIRRPHGQQKVGDDVLFAPTRELDFELELGCFLASGTSPGSTVSVDDAPDLIKGLVLVNDWSARDVQRWEYQPLGPFLAKSFATTISPWIVDLEALKPFAVEGMLQDPNPLPHLTPRNGNRAYDIQLEVTLKTQRMTVPQVICTSNAKHLYWSFAQQLAHQASNGTPLEVGDLYATGTISGELPGTFGSMLELSWRGTQPLTMLETGETRSFLEDGDQITLRGWAQGDDYRIGFGDATGTVQPA
jgi:fumarylacetoacetase